MPKINISVDLSHKLLDQLQKLKMIRTEKNDTTAISTICEDAITKSFQLSKDKICSCGAVVECANCEGLCNFQACPKAHDIISKLYLPCDFYICSTCGRSKINIETSLFENLIHKE